MIYRNLMLTFAILISSCGVKEEETSSGANTTSTNSCQLVADYQAELSEILPVGKASAFNIGRWTEADRGSGLDLRVFTGFENVQGITNYLTHIGNLFGRWNTASGIDYISLNAGDARSTNNNPDNATTAAYATDSEIGVYVKGSFDNNNNEGVWFECLDSGILALVSYQVVHLRGEDSDEYVEWRIVDADLIFNASDHNFSVFNGGNPPASPGEFYDFDAVLIHELGHFLGILGHTSDSLTTHGGTSVMLPTLAPGEALATAKTPQAIDTEIIQVAEEINTGANLTAKNFALSYLYPNDYNFEKEPQHGIIALHADGKCVHTLNGKTVYVHKENPAQFKRNSSK